MVNVPPPLLCSTPPPIDFGEDDDDSGLQSTLQLEDADADEYSEYGLVIDTNEAALNAKVPTLPELPISSSEPLPSDLSNGHGKSHSPVEAFNYQVKTNDFEQQTTVSNQEELEEMDQQPVAEEQEEEDDETNTNDNVPSLKLDSLSLYSNESISATCTPSPVADEQAATKVHAPVVHQVTLEDVSDDSDEECSPKKPKELFIPEGAADFFAIEILHTPTKQAPAMSIPILDTKQEFALPTLQSPAISTSIPDIEQDFATFPNVPAPEELNGNGIEKIEEEVDDFGDFGDFADFSAVPEATEHATLSMSALSNDDGFDDFQDFATRSTTTAAPTHEPQPPTNVDANNVDDDDDFGDFAESTYVSAPAIIAPVLPQPPAPTAAPLSINERVRPVLELMFPKVEVSSAQQGVKQSPLAQTQSLHFGAIEQAHALDYQWASSEMRHSLVRSLAIDSRNILFGDKWSSSMPRYAANLSFDPLKPIKPLLAAPSTSTSVLEPQSASSWRTSSNSSTQQPNQGLEAIGATAATQANQTKAQPGTSHGQGTTNGSDEAGAAGSISSIDDASAATSVFTAATTTAPLSPALSADGNGHSFDNGEQLAQQQQQLDLRKLSPSPPTPSPSPSPPPIISSNSSSTSFALPLKETHIYTPSKSDTAVAKTTTLAPIDFDYEIASAGIIIDETVVKKEYRDVEYKPPPASYALDSPSKLNATGKPSTEEDDFSDFQSVPAMKNPAQLQPPRNGTPTFGEQMILSPAILLPQSVPLAKPSIEWGDNALASINAEELARIEELFSHQSKPPTISATVAQQSPKQQQQQQRQQELQHQQEDDEWSDFVSVPVQQQLQMQQNNHLNHNNNMLNMQNSRQDNAAAKQEDDWSDFVSSNPLPAHVRAAPQFNSGAWQTANFYNNPLSLYQHQQQPHAHSNLVPKYQKKSNSSTNNNNNNNNNNNTPQQIHMMHDFSTVPTATTNAVPATYQQQHHQHHQRQLQQQKKQQQQRQQFHVGNAKVAPRISLIPDLSFVAPALPTNAGAFMSSLPKPSFSTKK